MVGLSYGIPLHWGGQHGSETEGPETEGPETEETGNETRGLALAAVAFLVANLLHGADHLRFAPVPARV